MRDFHTLTKIRIVIFDAQFREVLAYPADREQFCTLLRQMPGGNEACRKSDMAGCRRCADTGQVVTYRCHAGLTEAVVPVPDKNGVLAYVMFGQILTQRQDGKCRQALVKKYPQLAEAAQLLPVKTEEELRAAATVLQAITSFMMTNRWVTPGKSDFIRQLDRYIEDHVSGSIGVEEICTALCIGRTRLYEISAGYLGCGIAEYIRRRRIFHARNLLRESTMPVTEVAYAVGFTDYNHFSRVFRKLTGMSAREYRNNNK
ncbi:MAG: PocR ligand-binding domain-containing protein [Oscillospiraceae bacterium]|nr:PocR ligand-binding domain-containing protein [Oscillospiraceae bacterium]